MDLRLELIPIPVSDIARAKAFYVDKLGFAVKDDVQVDRERRVINLTPPGSACSIVFGTGMPKIEIKPGSLRGLHLFVDNLDAAREELISRGVEVEEIFTEKLARGEVRIAAFTDPDGNAWALLE